MRYPVNFVAISNGYHYGKCLDFGWNDKHGGPNVPIYSCADGTVISTAVTPKGGNNVYIEHDSGVVSNYCHLSKVTVKVGDKVAIGQQIGNMGQTGSDATGNHLHFGLYSNKSKMGGNSDLDPFSYLELYSDQTVGSTTQKNYGSKIKIHQENEIPDNGKTIEQTTLFKVNDIVVPIKLVNYTGTKLIQYDKNYVITELKGDRAVLSANRNGKMIVWAAMNINNIKKVD